MIILLCLVLFSRILIIPYVDADSQSKHRSIRNSIEVAYNRAICAAFIRLAHPTFRHRRDFPSSNQLTADFARLPSDPKSI